MRDMPWKVVGIFLTAACLAISFLPHFGPPHFRYTGCDPNTHVWNLGWPLATAIYDEHSGLHVGPLAFLLVPLVVLVAGGTAVVFARVASREFATTRPAASH